MKNTVHHTQSCQAPQHRTGSILVLSAVMLVVVFAFVVFSVDAGFLTLTKGQLQNASDAATLTASAELSRGIGLAPELSPSGVENAAQDVAAEIAALHAAGDRDSVWINKCRDVRLGQLQWDAPSQSWVKKWGVAPYTLVEVTTNRLSSSGSGSADGPVPLFFGPVIGHESGSLSARSAAAIMAGGGFRISANSSAKSAVLPIALDVESWDDLLQGTGGDDYSWNPLSGVQKKSDGFLEVSLYPAGNQSLPPGNRGTVDLGSPNNSTKDLKRQIREGLNATDLSWFGGELRFDQPLSVNGDPGVSAGIESALKDVIGEVRAIPLFTNVSGPGNNAQYEIDRFVGVRIMDVKLTGNPNQRRVVVQPAVFMDATVVRSTTQVQIDSIFTRPVLVQ